MYQHVLIPTDGSDEAEAAARHSVDLAEALGATVHAMFVIESRVTGLPSDSLKQAKEVDEYRDHGFELTQRVADMASEAGLECEQVVKSGKPYEEIVEYADESDVDVIAMGTRGHDGLEDYILGTVTERVVRSSSVPVLTVRRPKLE